MSDQIIINRAKAEAKVYKETATKSHEPMYLVKVSFTDIGLYLGAITVQPSPKYPDSGLWVQLPRYFRNGVWHNPLEANSSAPFWALLEQLVIEAVQEYKRKRVRDDVYTPSDEELADINKTVSDGIDDFYKEQPP